ncbi:hypothetical protein M2271_005150 [Streptomyces sp. LBL]|nr:hypothetical protein [Streptomyces sp. LBL]
MVPHIPSVAEKYPRRAAWKKVAGNQWLVAGARVGRDDGRLTFRQET